MIRNLAALLSLAAVISGYLALSAQLVEAKNSAHIAHKNRNFLVPPPPPYTPSIITVPASDADVEKQVDLYRKYLMSSNSILRQNKDEIPQVGQPHLQVSQPNLQANQANPYMTFDPKVEKKAQKQMDSFDSRISSKEKEISKLLNLAEH